MSGLHNTSSPPPRWAELLLGLLLPWHYRAETLGDLREGFARRAGGAHSTSGPDDEPRNGSPHARNSAARAWYVRQALRSIPGAVRLRYQTRHDFNESEVPMETLSQDIRYALRALVKNPGFAIVATITLALAIGVNTSIFSIVNVIVFADLPMQESETVSLIRATNAELGVDQGSVSPADYFDLVERARSYESLSALTEGQWVLTGGDQPMRVTGLQVSAGLFETWRLPPVIGRAFADGEDREGADRVAMLTHGFWQDQYAGRPDVTGESITLDGLEYTIIGVTDPKLEFASFRTTQVLIPLILNHAEPDRAARYLFVVGRLASGVTQEMATDEARRIGDQLQDEHPAQNRGWTLWSASAMDSLIDDEGNLILLMLQLTVGMVILIACANVANMLLARASARSRELAVRAALGAGRRRLIRQLLTESLVISLSAAALGIGIAHLMNRGLVWISAGTEEIFLMATLDSRVLGFTLLVSLVAPVAFGLFPALRASSSSPSSTLRDGRSSDGGRSGKRTRSVLVTAQISLALTLMIVATLLTRTVVNMNTRPLGFDATDVLTVRLTLPEADYGEADATLQFFTETRETMAAIPGFGTVELTSTLSGAGIGARRSVEIEGVEMPEGRAAPTALFNTISNGYFELLGLSLQSGRTFTETDTEESFQVAVVSREVADRFWPDVDPVGRRLRVAESEEWIQVVGVVADVRSTGNSDTQAANIYVPHAQDPRRVMFLLARTSSDPGLVAGPIRDAVWSIDAQLPVDAIQTMERAHYENAASDFAILSLFVTFAVFALIMAAVGIYGVMAYSVAQRRTEIGLRMALGAEVSSVRWMILVQGGRLLGAGIVIGLAAAFGLSRLLEGLVFGLSATDPLTFIGVPLVLAAVALVANLVPARRATRLHPANTLRGD